MIGTVLSLSIVLIKMLKPDLHTKLIYDECTNLTYIYAEPSPGIHFPSVDHIRTCLTKLSWRYQEINIVVLNLEKWETIDYTAALAVKSLYSSLMKDGRILLASNLNKELQRALMATGMPESKLSCKGVSECLKNLTDSSSISDSHGLVSDQKVNLREGEEEEQSSELESFENAINITSVQITNVDVVKPLI